MNQNKPLIAVLGISLGLNVLLFILLYAVTSREGETPGMNVDVQTRPGPISEVASATAEAPILPMPSPTMMRATASPESEEPAVTLVSMEAAPTQVPTPTPSATPQPSPTVAPSSTPEPTPTMVPSPTAVVLQGPAWLRYLNQFRLQAGLPPVSEDPALSEGGRLHSTYMGNTGNISHNEDPGSPFYTKAGQAAGQNGNLATSFISATEFDWAVNYWISAPFHALPVLDPQLATVGFGTYREASAPIEVAATLDIKQGLLPDVPASVQFPVLFPRDGGEAWVLRYSLPEFPDGRGHCGFGSVAGAPIIVQIGAGDQVPQVTSTQLHQSGRPVEHCYFDETNYVNSNASMQQAGRSILDQRDAIVILPRQPLTVGEPVSVDIVVNGTAISWSFNPVKPPPLP